MPPVAVVVKDAFLEISTKKAGRSQNLQLKKLKRQGNTNANNKSKRQCAPLQPYAII
jgi:hypothetical protein